MFGLRKKEKPKKIRKLTSIAFLIAIPANFLIGSIFILATVAVFARGAHRPQPFLFFLLGLILTYLFWRTLKVSRLRVFIHELKHALVVLFTGNIVKGFHVQHDEGNVEFQMYKDRVQYGPFITLAPYCMPLFAIPTFVCAFFVDSNPSLLPIAAACLGVALGVDLETAFHELHPHQTDFKQIVGGFFASALYISSVIYFSLTACALLALGGRSGFAEAGIAAIGMGMNFAERFPHWLQSWAAQ